MAAGLTQRRRDALAGQLARGRARVLAVGVDGYSADSGFMPRTTGRNDAVAFANCFRDIAALAADPEAITALVSGGAPAPSRGEIVRGLRRLVQAASAGDRPVFHFSGRGHCIGAEVYLVPEDAYTDDDPSCLIALSTIRDLFNRCDAEQSLVVLDLCFRGVPARRWFDAYGGRATIAVAMGDDASNLRSPNPQHSLLTAYVLPALRGAAPEALTDRLLTAPGLITHAAARVGERGGEAPVLCEPTRGTCVLADFSGPLLDAGFGFDGALFARVELTGAGRAVAVKDILTSLSRTTYTQAYLETRVNAALAGHLQEALGQVVSRLRSRFHWASSEVGVEDGGVVFPDGHCQPRYVATGKLHGEIVDELSLASVWLERPAVVAELLQCLGLEPDRVTFVLKRPVVPGGHVARLEANGWRCTSELAHKVEAEKDGCALVLQNDALTLTGLPLRALFAATPDAGSVRAAAAALAIFG